ncbi:MAG: hypothetical protein HY898_17485 [Deltaproteobacteria bacterium]|nr:hypothetical protein [Deltaproteobacteria bacterium]
MRRAVTAAVVAAAPLVLLAVPLGGGPVQSQAEPIPTSTPISSELPDSPPERTLRLLFIHHSCGGQWLADNGTATEEGASCIYQSHPNGGGLRRALALANYEVHEASYGSEIGENTELLDWLPKFRDKMDAILSVSHQDERYQDGGKNDVVVFKSCYTSNDFTSEGAAPGDPGGRELTVWNARASMTALLGEFAKHPKTLFLNVTTPPLAPRLNPAPAWKWLLKALLRRPQDSERLAERARLARVFHDWVVSPDGWLAGYEPKNVAVFDYYGVLTGNGRSNLSVFPTGLGLDSHPSSSGNAKASAAFLPLLNRAVHRAEIAK